MKTDGNQKLKVSIVVVVSVAFIIALLVLYIAHNSPIKRIEIAKDIFITPDFACSNKPRKISSATAHRPIPRVMYRTWKERDLPMNFKKAWVFTEEHNPGYTQLLFTDDDVANFMRAYTANRLQKVYFSINPKFGAARADIYRYAVLYEFGGVYIDIKSTAQCLDDAMRDDDAYVLSKWPVPVGQFKDFCGSDLPYACKRGEYEQWWIISAPKHPFLKRVLSDIMDTVEKHTPEDFPPCDDDASAVKLGSCAQELGGNWKYSFVWPPAQGSEDPLPLLRGDLQGVAKAVENSWPKTRCQFSSNFDGFAVVGMHRDVGAYSDIKKPFTVTPSVYAFYMLNGKATVSNRVFFPPKLVWGDVEFNHLAEEAGLAILKVNRFFFHKANLQPRSQSLKNQEVTALCVAN